MTTFAKIKTVNGKTVNHAIVDNEFADLLITKGDESFACSIDQSDGISRGTVWNSSDRSDKPIGSFLVDHDEGIVLYGKKQNRLDHDLPYCDHVRDYNVYFAPLADAVRAEMVK